MDGTSEKRGDGSDIDVLPRWFKTIFERPEWFHLKQIVSASRAIEDRLNVEETAAEPVLHTGSQPSSAQSNPAVLSQTVDGARSLTATLGGRHAFPNSATSTVEPQLYAQESSASLHALTDDHIYTKLCIILDALHGTEGDRLNTTQNTQDLTVSASLHGLSPSIIVPPSREGQTSTLPQGPGTLQYYNGSMQSSPPPRVHLSPQSLSPLQYNHSVGSYLLPERHHPSSPNRGHRNSSIHHYQRTPQDTTRSQSNAWSHNSNTSVPHQQWPPEVRNRRSLSTSGTAFLPMTSPQTPGAFNDPPSDAFSGLSMTHYTDAQQSPSSLRIVQAGASSVRRPDSDEALYDSFKVRPASRHFFKVGRVFMILWTEPLGNDAQSTISRHTFRGPFGEYVHSKVRRFVVIAELERHSLALPIMSYNSQGVGKRGVTKADHSIVYIGPSPPDPRPDELPQRGEAAMLPIAIKVTPDDPSERMTDTSRINYGKPHSIEHNTKARSVGMVYEALIPSLIYQYQTVMTRVTPGGLNAIAAASERA